MFNKVMSVLCVGMLSAVAHAESLELGVAFGQSQLDPNAASPIVITEDSDDTLQVSVARIINDSWKAQLRYTDLGEAELSGVATVEYTVWSLAAQYTLPVLQDSSVSLHVVGGIAFLDSDATGVSIEEDSSEELMLGFGANYALDNNWAVQLEGTLYSKDVSAVTLGLAKRF